MQKQLGVFQTQQQQQQTAQAKQGAQAKQETDQRETMRLSKAAQAAADQKRAQGEQQRKAQEAEKYRLAVLASGVDQDEAWRANGRFNQGLIFDKPYRYDTASGVWVRK